MRRFSRHWDLMVNSGNFARSAPLIWSKSESAFAGFMKFSDWIYGEMGRNHGIALGMLAELLFTYLTDVVGTGPHSTANLIYDDYERGGRSDKPVLLRPYLEERVVNRVAARGNLPKRQARHLAGAD